MGYFKPLRRKIGVLTLLLACVFAAGWVRSITRVDRIVICCSRLSRQQFKTDGDGFWYLREVSQRPVTFAHVQMFDWRLPAFHGWPGWPYREESWNFQTDWRWQAIGFDLGKFHFQDEGISQGARRWSVAIRVRFWSIVIPLSLLSAYLLLSKPRTRNPPGTERAIIPPTSTGPDKDPAIASAPEVAADR